jgi:ferredoxin
VWTVEIDQTRCLGTGLCAGSRPDRFALEGQTARPVDRRIEPEDGVLDIAETCPTEAISVRDEDGTLLAPEP